MQGVPHNVNTLTTHYSFQWVTSEKKETLTELSAVGVCIFLGHPEFNSFIDILEAQRMKFMHGHGP